MHVFWNRFRPSENRIRGTRGLIFESGDTERAKNIGKFSLRNEAHAVAAWYERTVSTVDHISNEWGVLCEKMDVVQIHYSYPGIHLS